MEIKYSAEAQALLDEMPGFDHKAFAEWWIAQQRSVGSRNVLEFLMHTRRAADIVAKAKTE